MGRLQEVDRIAVLHQEFAFEWMHECITSVCVTMQVFTQVGAKCH